MARPFRFALQPAYHTGGELLHHIAQIITVSADARPHRHIRRDETHAQDAYIPPDSCALHLCGVVGCKHGRLISADQAWKIRHGRSGMEKFTLAFSLGT